MMAAAVYSTAKVDTIPAQFIITIAVETEYTSFAVDVDESNVQPEIDGSAKVRAVD